MRACFFVLFILTLSCSGIGQEKDVIKKDFGGSPLNKGRQIGFFEKRIREIQNKGILPIIDVEFHYGGWGYEKIIRRMDENEVALTWMGPNERLGSEESIRLHGLHPDRFVPTTVHGDGPGWHGSDKAFLEKLATDVRSGKYFAMGEFEARHYVSSTNNRDVHMRVDAQAMQVVFGLSSETGIPFLLHHEAEDALLPELERMLLKYPQARVIWCHAGRNRNPHTWKKLGDPDGVRDFLKRFPNLYFDLVQSSPGERYRGTGYVDAVMYNSMWASSLDRKWKVLFEEFPDRFVIGSDINGGRFSNYTQVIKRFRTVVFADLNKDAARKIAFTNAWKFMTGKEWETE